MWLCPWIPKIKCFWPESLLEMFVVWGWNQTERPISLSLLTGTLGPSDNTKESVFCSTAKGKHDKPKAANILHQMAARGRWGPSRGTSHCIGYWDSQEILELRYLDQVMHLLLPKGWRKREVCAERWWAVLFHLLFN